MTDAILIEFDAISLNQKITKMFISFENNLGKKCVHCDIGTRIFQHAEVQGKLCKNSVE